ncbi:hypothetical protein HL653_00370 [Sphingomonas sp. AP4-R1]|uniref:hypothetical protein n=1 Tax=Sphingomonas sp. AP4-R1 TaxID=2735134 RepID=UPI0014939485|nr:hypothetical protein [Sphingomonas sp. AP4-R1]QJU56441.1 hypothetical protein HL653_00370 [Sphingomonas sp. AP4-R1]
MATGAAVIGGAALLALAAAQHTSPSAKPAALPPARPITIQPTVVGMNLGQGQYYSQEWIFADLVQNNGLLEGVDHKPLDVKVDASGHPVDVPKGKEIWLLLQISAIWKSGDYRCSISPGWTPGIRFSGTISGGDENFKLTVPPGIEGNLVVVKLTAKHDGANLAKASCIPVGMVPDAMFTPEFLDDMKPFGIIRFMDWMQTNNAPPQTWAGRPKPTDFSQLKGMAVENMVALANKLGADPWFTLPFDADPEYYRNFAIYVRDHLAPGRKAYVELSNEVWNPGFKQDRDAAERGKARYPGVEPYQAADYYYADRVIDMMKIWDEVFVGQMPRIVRVAGGQIGWKERSDGLLAHKDLWKSVDAYAIAAYFGGVIQDIPESGPARVDKVLARLPDQGNQVITSIEAQKAVVAKYGVSFITYEGGLDVTGFTPDAVKDSVAVVHDPRLYDIYTNFLEDYRKRIGGLLVLYNGTSSTNYGHKDYTGQPLSATTPKMRAVLDFMKRHPQ